MMGIVILEHHSVTVKFVCILFCVLWAGWGIGSGLSTWTAAYALQEDYSWLFIIINIFEYNNSTRVVDIEIRVLDSSRVR